MARHYAYHVDGFKGNPIEKIRAEFDKWSDYEIHQVGNLSHLHEEIASMLPQLLRSRIAPSFVGFVSLQGAILCSWGHSVPGFRLCL